LPESTADGPAKLSTRRSAPLLFWVGVGLLALNLRIGVASIPPILPELKSRLGLTTTSESILVALPVVCFGVVSSIAAVATRRFGEERVLGTAMAGVAIGLSIRALWPTGLLFLGTVVMAGSIALANVLLASLIKRREPHRAGLLIGVYLVALSGGASVASAVTVPLFNAAHGSVHTTLGIWALPAVLALVVWAPQLRHRTIPSIGRRQRLGLVHQPLAWQVTSFMGLQSCCYYSVVSWLPTMIRHRGSSATAAGIDVAMLSIGSVIGSFTTPTFAVDLRHHQKLVAPIMVVCILGIGGLLFAPLGFEIPLALLLGTGQGAALALALLFVIARSPNPAAAASLSAMSQGIGYSFAATGPLAVGLVHVVSRSWTWAFGVVLFLSVAEWISAWFAARPITLEILEHAGA